MTNQTPKQFSSFKAEIASARAVALKEARAESPFPKSRGTFLGTSNERGGCHPVYEGEAIEWDGTKKSLDALVALVIAEYPQATTVYVMGGYDGYETFADQLEHGDYDPSVSVWEVTYWTRQA